MFDFRLDPQFDLILAFRWHFIGLIVLGVLCCVLIRLFLDPNDEEMSDTRYGLIGIGIMALFVLVGLGILQHMFVQVPAEINRLAQEEPTYDSWYYTTNAQSFTESSEQIRADQELNTFCLQQQEERAKRWADEQYPAPSIDLRCSHLYNPPPKIDHHSPVTSCQTPNTAPDEQLNC